MTDHETTAIASYNRETRPASTGPRRTAPGLCPVCGEPVPDRPFLGDATCGRNECRDAEVRR